jgi:acetyl-CoA carboxylase carboxyltransferase component
MTDRKSEPGAWKPLLEDLERRRAEARAMGGEEKLARQRSGGRMDARQRLEALLDPESFRELGTLVGSKERAGLPAVAADALVCGMGTIEGRPVLVGSEDFTSKGGSIGLGTHAKRVRLARLASQERVPLVMMLDGAGERVTNSLERHPYAPNDLQALAELSGQVPTVCLVLGASAGHGALTAPLMDFVVMVEGAALFSAGPPLVAAATGEQVTKEQLGGARMHAGESGVVQNLAATEEEAIALARRYLGYFPSNAWEIPPRSEVEAERSGRIEEVLEVLPSNDRRPYDMRRLVELLVDRESVLEVQPAYGGSLLTILARLGGAPVAILANQPLQRAGAIDRDAADKGTHFLEVAGAFHLPVVFLTDNPGVMAGSVAERTGALRAAARLFFAQSRLQVPKLHVTVRKAFGFGSSIMAMNPFDGQTLTLALPGATLGAMPAAGGGSAAGLEAELQAQLDTSQSEGPWAVADTLGFDEVIDPRDLRATLLAGLKLASHRSSGHLGPARAHGIRP